MRFRSARKARAGPLSFIGHAPITRKLRQRLRLTFTKCQDSFSSSFWPGRGRLNIVLTRHASRDCGRARRSIVHFSLRLAIRTCSARRTTRARRGNTGKNADTRAGHRALRLRPALGSGSCTRAPLEHVFAPESARNDSPGREHEHGVSWSESRTLHADYIRPVHVDPARCQLEDCEDPSE